jgi:hypothetical protein
MSVPYHWAVGQWVRAPTGNESGAIYGYAVISALFGSMANVSFAVTGEVATVPVSSLIPSYPYHSHPFYIGEVVLTTQVPGDDVLSVGLVIKCTDEDGLYLVMFLDGTTSLFEASQLTAANPHAYPSFLFANVSTLVASVHHAQTLAASQNNGIVSLGSQAVSDINTLQWQNVIDRYRNHNNQEGE